MLACEVPSVGAHLVNTVLRLPAKLAESFVGICVALRNIARSAVDNFIFNRLSACLFKRLYNLQNAVSVAGAEIINLNAVIAEYFSTALT